MPAYKGAWPPTLAPGATAEAAVARPGKDEAKPNRAMRSPACPRTAGEAAARGVAAARRV